MTPEEKQIEKTRADTVKSINKAVQAIQKGNCGYLATHVGAYTDSHVPSSVSWYSEEAKQPDSPYLSFHSILSDDMDAISSSAAFCTPGKLLSTPANRAWGIEDTAQLRTHLLNDDDLAKEIFRTGATPYEETRKTLLSMPKCPPPETTSKLVHQVYFPMADGSYHLLSVLPSPIVMNEIRKRRSAMNRQQKEARENKDSYEVSCPSVPLSFGGAHALNVSALAFHAGSRGFPAFFSAAPNLRLHEEDRPRSNFFRHCYYTKNMKDDFLVLFNNLIWRNSDIQQRCIDARDTILDVYLEQIYLLRNLSAHWSDEENIHLTDTERLFLDIGYADELEDEDFEDFRDDAQAFARKIFRHLMKDHKLVKAKKLSFDDDDAFRVIGDAFYKELRLCFS